jgi:hypothetical protein
MPPPLPPLGDAAYLIRTDFSSEATWQAIVDTTTQENSDGFVANLTVVSDLAWTSASVKDVRTALAGDEEGVVAFVFDSAAASDEKHSLLCINLTSKKVRTMRVLPSEVWSVENNLSLGNMEWSDFASALKEGVFEGF